MIRRLMVKDESVSAAGASTPIEEVEPAVAPARASQAITADRADAAPRAVRASVNLLASLGPIFRAALVFPGVDSPAGAWAGAVRRMSEVSTKLTNQLAQMQRDEIDIAWARRELHPAVVKIVAEFWIAAVLRGKGIRSIDDVPLRPEEMLPGLVAAERAAHGHAPMREPVALPVEVEILPALALVTVNAQAYADLLRTSAGVEASMDTYVLAVADAVLAAIARGADRAEMPGLDRRTFMLALLGASTGIVVKACEVAINETLQLLTDALNSGAPPPIPDSGFPIERSVALIEVGIGRLAGTYAYIAQRTTEAAGE